MKPSRLLIFMLGALAGVTVRAVELNVFAAASLADAMKEIAMTYEPSSGDKLRYNFAASSALALQIKNGAPADVFFSADEAKMNDLARSGLILADTRTSLLSNTLVIVVNADGGAAVRTPSDLAESAVQRVALAEPQTVPAGIYAKEYLEKTGLWKKIADKVIPTESVRACLAAVEVGNADAGIVYKTDGLISKKIKIAYEIPVQEGPRISYPLAVVKASSQLEHAEALVAYLSSPEAKKVFQKYGFLMPP